jgi:4-amino-4-deoxy-L-arabinose transferase-like glycosyltransferase
MVGGEWSIMTETNQAIDGWQPVDASGARGGVWASLGQALLRRPALTLALLCALQIVLWTVMPALVDVAPPRDVVEGFMWGREWVLLTYKHPQLPGWLLEISHLLTGSFRWPQFTVSQLTVTATFVLVYLLARDMLGRSRALVAVLLLPSMYFFEWPTPQFNHDYAQMPFWAAVCWLLWRGVNRSGPGWWLALGLVAGVGMYAKFSTGLLLVFGGLWLLSDARGRARLATPWPWLGLAVFLGVVAPLAIELVRVDFLPMTYAATRDAWIMVNRARLYYIGVQLAGLAAFFAVLALAGLFQRPAPGTMVAAGAPLDRRSLGYLLWMGVGPAVLVMIASLFTGVGEAWGTPMYNLFGIVAVALLGQRLGSRETGIIAVCAALSIVLMSSAYAAIRWTRCNVYGDLLAVCWPAQAISQQAEAIWHAKVPGPLGIVGGENGVAMLAGLNASDKPSIFTNLDTRLAPWITPQRLREQGMLLVWQDDGTPPKRIAPWIKNVPTETAAFKWSPKASPMTIKFAVIAPGTADLPLSFDDQPEDAPGQ